jgi:translation initiation factor IF-2
MKENQTQSNTVVRPPVVVVMGHVDHGKSTLLDYIRKTNIVDKEAGGITQHISAYEVVHKDEADKDRKITFLDTPGHEAFSKMRARGASTADIAILVVSAEDSVKAQTIEAWNTIIESKVPYIVAINKIDKPNANVEKTKMDLLEKGIYLEGLGGDVPFVPISAKAGTGIDELLGMILLVADLSSFTGNPKANATGVIIEAHRDPKRGISATGVIKDGSIKAGMYVVAGEAITTTRIMENFLGKPVKEMTFSSPIRFVGFDEVPPVGGTFTAFATKKEAEAFQLEHKSESKKSKGVDGTFEGKTIPIIIKTDVSGTIEALEKEIEKINTPEISFRIVNAGVGAIGEADLKAASIDSDCVILGFNVKLEPNARDLNETLKVNVQIFDIIYKLIDYIKEILEERRPRQEVTEVSGSAKVLKIFNGTKDKQIVGGKITAGKVSVGNTVRIMRRDFEIGRGKIVGLEQSKIKASFVEEGTECGILVETKVDIATGDVLESFTITVK